VPFVRFVTPSPLGSHPRRHKMQPLQHAHLRCPPRRIRRRAPQNVIKRSTLGSCADPSKISVGKSSTSSENREWKTPCRVKLDMRSAVPGLGYFGIIGIRFGTPVFATSFIPFWCTVFHDICFPLLGPRSAPWVGIKMFSTVSIPRSFTDRRGAWVWPVSRLLSNSTTPQQRPDRQAKPRRGN